MASVRHAAVRAAIIATGRGRTWRSAEALDEAIGRRAPWPAAPPRSGHGVVVTQRDRDGLRLVSLVPPRPSGSVVALHGGGTVFGPERQHWDLWRRIAVASGRTVVAALHPLAPQGRAGEVVPAVARLTASLEGPVALLGDSAGGGIALAAALLLREQGIRPALLLSAPWLDLTLEHPWRMERDPWLAVPGLRRAADLWRGDLPLSDPLVSPLLADLDGLGPIVAASGTADVLHRDALRLQQRVPIGRPFRLLTGEGLLHNYPLLPVPEARGAVAALVRALR